jgi:hypothetical protein
MDNVDIFYGLLVYITDIWSILQLFSKFCGNLVYFMYGNLVYFLYGNLVYFMYGNLVYIFPFWYVVPRKIWQPWYTWPHLTSKCFKGRVSSPVRPCQEALLATVYPEKCVQAQQ